jgi:hypothetical membrane protein
MSGLETRQASGSHGVDPRGASGVRAFTSASVAAWAGIAGPILFTATFLAQELARTAEYSPVAEPVSALEAGPGGWVQQANFVVFGLFTIAFAIGMHFGVRPAPFGIVGPLQLAVSGVGLVLAAVLPLREDAAGVTYDPGGHIVAGVLFFATSSIGLVVLSRRLRRDPRWQGVAAYTLVAGLTALAGFVVAAAAVMPDDAPLHDYAGLYQRVLILTVLFPARVVLARRLLQVSRGRLAGDLQ